jgi:low temperature requirement protein LtrA
MDAPPAGIAKPQSAPESQVVHERTHAAARPWRLRMSGRDPREAHRASTPLELLFDLCFVVAVAQAGAALHRDLTEGALAHGAFAYLVVFFTIWWPWLNFTWFASAYDTDDVPYRLLVFVQIAGVLIVAAGVPRIFEDLDFRIAVIGYIIMRLSLVGLWLRAAREDPPGRAVALHFAAGIGLVQILWVVRLFVGGGPAGIALLFAFAAIELAIPIWAERSGRHTPWHPEHIAERYGLFTIIVLGECILAATTAIQEALTDSGVTGSLIAVAVGGLLLVCSLWWAYFKAPPVIGHFRSLRWMISWGYGHYVVFASLAALGAGLQVAADGVADPEHVPAITAALSVAVPTSVALLAIATLHHGSVAAGGLSTWLSAILPVPIALAAPSIGVPLTVLAIGIAVALVVAYGVARLHQRAGATEQAHEHEAAAG